MRIASTSVSLIFTALIGGQLAADDTIFSGPQIGEKLSEFKVRGFFEPNHGKELDFVKQAAGKPIVLVFIHDGNRSSLRFTQVLSNYTCGVVDKGLATGVVWLADDITEAENTLKQNVRVLTQEAPTGISLDGGEGPGSYGLNRKITLTILIGKAGRVTANFALIQPNIEVDLPKILIAIAKVMGTPAATLEDLLIVPNAKLRVFFSRLVLKSADRNAVDEEAQRIENYVKQDETARQELGRIASKLVRDGNLSRHGTPHAQEYFRKWATEFGGEKKQ